MWLTEFLASLITFPSIMIGCFLLAMFIMKNEKRRNLSNLNEPPFVPFKIPVIGHTIDFFFRPKTFLRKCREQYGDMFSIYVWGQIITIAGKDSIHEVLGAFHDFMYTEALNEMLPLDEVFPNIGVTNAATLHSKFSREFVTPNLEKLVPRMVRKIEANIDQVIGKCEEPTVYRSLFGVITRIIAASTADVGFGEELSLHEDCLDSFSTFTNDLAPVLGVPPILSFIHPKLHQFVVTLPLKIGLNKSIYRHRKIMLKRLKPEVMKRLALEEKLGDAWEKPLDVLQVMMDDETVFNKMKPNYDHLIELMHSFAFSAISSTSRTATNTLFEYAGRPEYWDELYEEATFIRKQYDGKITKESLSKMEKLDSFVKEGLRFQDTISGLAHKTVRESYTFESGYQVPQGRHVHLYFKDVYDDPVSQGPNPSEFDGFRHYREGESAVKVHRKWLGFGGGRHVCPGRFLAVSVIKIFLHVLILRYHIRTESGKVEPKRQLGPWAEPSNKGIVFEKRGN